METRGNQGGNKTGGTGRNWEELGGTWRKSGVETRGNQGKWGVMGGTWWKSGGKRIRVGNWEELGENQGLKQEEIRGQIKQVEIGFNWFFISTLT